MDYSRYLPEGAHAPLAKAYRIALQVIIHRSIIDQWLPQLSHSVRTIEPSDISTNQIFNSGKAVAIRRQARPIAFARCGNPIPKRDGRAITQAVTPSSRRDTARKNTS